MNKAELIKEIRRIQKEEQDYQALFKLILKRSGKDIRSMSDEEKKKFFSAVDKAYKAKTEGKLKINKKLINEALLDQIIDTGLMLFVMSSFISWIFNEMKEWFGKKSSSNEEDEEVDNISSEIIYQLVNDSSAQKRVANYLAKNIRTVGTKEIVEKIITMSNVKQKIKTYFSKNKDKINKNITEKDIEDNIRYVFEIRFGDKNYIKSFSIK